jgi:hypothetical protein
MLELIEVKESSNYVKYGSFSMEATNKFSQELEIQRMMQWVCQPDGSLLIPAGLVARWENQIDTKYAELDEQERESDREQVRKYLPIIAAALAERVDRD